MFYNAFKTLLRITLRIFYKEFRVNCKENLLTEGPLLIAANHPNTLMDPLVLACLFKQRVGFLAKSTVFVNKFIAWLFAKLHMIPLYRQQDAQEGKNIDNSLAFKKCFEYLNKKGTILIFPEGTSLNEMILRPVKTGAARISLEFEHQKNFEAGLRIIPVSLNYSDPAFFHSNLVINIGKPVFVRDFKEEYQKTPQEAVRNLTGRIQEKLGDLMVHASDSRQEILFKRIHKIYDGQLQSSLNIEKSSRAKFELSKEIINGLTYFQVYKRQEYDSIEQKISSYFKLINALKLHEDFINEKRIRSRSFFTVAITVIYLLLAAPIYLFGLITNYLPYTLPSRLTRMATSDTSYRAPIMMLLAMVLFPLFYYFEIKAFHGFTQNPFLTIIFGCAIPLSGFLVLHYWNKVRWIKSLVLIMGLKRKRKGILENLKLLRKQIIVELNRMKEDYIKTLESTKEVT